MTTPDRYLVDLAGTRKASLKIGGAFAVLTTRMILGTSGDLIGGAALSSDVTLGLANTAVVAGSYGDAAHVAGYTVDAKGRITGATVYAITASGIGAAATSHSHAWADITSGVPTTLAGYGISDAVATSDSRLSDARTPSGAASGDLASSYPAPTVVGIRGVSIPVLANGWLKSTSGVLSWATPSYTDVGADVAGTAATLIAAHVALANPHTQYIQIGAAIPWSTVSSTPTTIVGYGITDGVVTSDSRLSDSRTPSGSAGGSLTGSYPNPTIANSAIVNAMISASAAIAWSKIDKSGAVPSDVGAAATSHSHAWSDISATPTTVAGYGITNAALSTITLTGVNSVTGGGDLTANRTFQLSGDTASPGTNQYYGTDGSGTKGWYAISASGGGAPVGATYVCVSLNGTLTNERALTAGTGLSLTDSGANANITFAVLYGTSGTTACVGNDSRLSDSRAPTGAAGGDLGGTYPNPTIQGSAIVTRLNAMTTADLKTSAIRIVDTTDVTKKMAWVLSGITTGTTRSITVPDASLTLAGQNYANAFTVAQTITAATGLTVLQAVTQDAVRVIGRAGGTSSYIASITTPTLAGNITVTLPNLTSTLIGSIVATVWPAANAAGILTNDGAGNLSWAAGAYIGGSIAADQIAYGSGANTIQGTAGFKYLPATSGITTNVAPSGFTVGTTTIASHTDTGATSVSSAAVLTYSSASYSPTMTSTSSGGGTLRGLYIAPTLNVNNASSFGNLYGFYIDQTLTQNSGGASSNQWGGYIRIVTGSLTGSTSAVGLRIQTVDTTSASTQGSSTGIEIAAIKSKASQVYGINISSVTNTAGSQAYGYYLSTLTAGGSGTAYGLYLTGITGGTGTTWGIYQNDTGIANYIGSSTTFGTASFVGSERVRIAGGSAPGTPGSTDVLIGAGAIKTGGNVSITGGALLISGSVNPFITLNDGTNTATFEVNSGNVFLSPPTGKIFAISSATTPGTPAATQIFFGGGTINAGASVLSSGATSGVGYATGAGGTVTQGTNRTTGVTLNKVCGAITLVSAAGSATPSSFTVTNSAVVATDVIKLNQKSGTDKYLLFVTNVAAGAFEITAYTTGGTTTEQPVISFAIQKAVTA